jgi:xanthine/CO dehydrogenase XdhC/CoxF family maturation factor
MWDTFFEHAIGWRAEEKPFALATVVACQRPITAYSGAKALIRADGALTGEDFSLLWHWLQRAF